MSEMIWKPHVTVAALAQNADGRFLMVHEEIEGRHVYNQPAGHLDEGESLIDAVIRETREETAWRFTPEALVGIYRWRVAGDGRTFLRVCFAGHCDDHDPNQPLDKEILAAVWLGQDDLARLAPALRSPLVRRAIDDYLAGQRYPLDLLKDVGEV